MKKNEKRYLHALCSLPSMNIMALQQCMTMYKSAEKIWHLKKTDFITAGIQLKTAEKIWQQKQLFNVAVHWREIEKYQKKYGLQLLTINDDQYPDQLKQISHPPLLLYCRGNLDLLNHEVLLAVVGSRKATSYGRQVVNDSIPYLSDAGAVIVSGLAYGIDAAAHQATVNVNGKTIAVLGSSVLPYELYPAVNRKLSEQIIQNRGLIISEYAPHSRSYPSNFPERNRIIAGLAQATIVIEATRKSGALITANYAIEYGREVFAVPGSIYTSLSEGTNYLISRGATPWLSCTSVCNGLEYLISDRVVSVTPAEKKLLAGIANNKAKINDIIDYQHRPTHEVLALITSLIMKGVLCEIGNQVYAKKPHIKIHSHN